MTADRSGSQSLHAASPILATTDRRPPRVLTQIAETVTRYGLPAFILSLPLEFTSQFLRLQLARIVLLVVALAFAYLIAVGARRISFPAVASVLVLCLYVAFSLVSWLFTRAPGSLNPLLDIAAYPFMAVLVVNLTRSEKEHAGAWTAFLLSSLGVAVLGACLYYTGYSIWRVDPAGLGRVNATFGDPNITARFLTLAVAAAIVMFASRRVNARLAIAVAAVGAAVLPLTFSKSGFLLFPVSVVLAMLLAVDRRRAAAIGIAVLAIFAMAILINPSTRDRSLLVVQSITGTTTNLVAPSTTSPQPLGGVQLDEVRTYLITAGWQMFKDHPIAGVGFGGFQHALKTDYSRFLPANPPATLSHTSAITILAEQGLVGALLLVVVLLLIAREAVGSLLRRTPWRDFALVPAFLVIPIVMYSQFEGRLIEEPYLWLVLGLFYSARMLERSIRTVQLPR